MKRNPDGLPMREDANVPLTAGVNAAAPEETVHDKAIPETVKTKDGRNFNLRESHDYHERVEHPMMQAGLSYNDAHSLATEVEHARMRALGFDPREIEALAQPHIDQAAHRAKAEGYSADKSLDNQPYRDSAEPMKRGKRETDQRVVHDRDGNPYTSPERYHAGGKVSFIIGRDARGYHAVEPSTGEHFTGPHPSRKNAERATDRRVADMGIARTRAHVDAQPPLSQQQLSETYG